MVDQDICTESVSVDRERMLEYKAFAVAFSYPDDGLFAVFPELSSKKEDMISEYDRLFRASELWLYGTEHLASNNFQRSNYLADIMGFYRAFGLEPDADRPDSLSCELEFMHYLILKESHAAEAGDSADAREKVSICLDAERKFFTEHLHPAAKKIAAAIISMSNNDFYVKISEEMLEFLESERKILGGDE